MILPLLVGASDDPRDEYKPARLVLGAIILFFVCFIFACAFMGQQR
jgi:hypothetical protein